MTTKVSFGYKNIDESGNLVLETSRTEELVGLEGVPYEAIQSYYLFLLGSGYQKEPIGEVFKEIGQAILDNDI